MNAGALCSWCGHTPHGETCTDRLNRLAPKTPESPCPCRHGQKVADQ